MGVLRQAPAGGWISADIEELAVKVKNGDGLVWQGDPALDLHVGVLTAKRPGYDETGRFRRRGDVVARRLEVHRHTEDGEDVMIGHWKLDEATRVLFDLVQMDPRSRGHVDLTKRLEAADDAKEKELHEQFVEAAAPMIEHQLLLAHDRNNPRHTFRQVNGLRDEPKSDI